MAQLPLYRNQPGRSVAHRPRLLSIVCAAITASGMASGIGHAQGSFVHWESPHTHPLDLTPDGARLLAVNSADARLEIFDAAGPELALLRALPIGIDPVSVRAHNDREAWVVDHVGDAVSIVDLDSGRVRATLPTDDEPCDVVFAGVPERAFVSCSQANTVLVFDPANLSTPPVRITLDAEDPRALAVSPDGRSVYAAIFESGNATTVIGGGQLVQNGFPPDAVSHPLGPHGGVNPPPNAGAVFEPAQSPGHPAPPPVALIVRRDAAGAWRDDTGTDWSSFVDGPQAELSGRPVGWELMDHDVAVIDTDTFAVDWIDGLMNIDMALAVRPTDGLLSVVGTESTNEIRFEPNLRSTFVRVQLAFVDVAGASTQLLDLNPHLTYQTPQIVQTERDMGLADPRAIVWNSSGTRAYVAGMGSNNVTVLDSGGARAGLTPTIEVAEGPTGLALDEAGGRLYVLGRFEAAISVIDLASELEIERVAFHDATPATVRTGRRWLYDSHETSGLGQASCASCHIDGRMDRLAWDLGDPSGDMFPTAALNLGGKHPLLPNAFPTELHPMKGPMLTQTLQDIIGKEPFHWRGDRSGIEAFSGAYVSLLGDDTVPNPAEIQQLEDYLEQLYYPPNPHRTLLNELPEKMPLPGHLTTGRFGPAGLPLPIGDATRGLELFQPPNLLDGEVSCSTCHTTPTGRGPNYQLVNFEWQPLADGPDGEKHHMLTMDGTQVEPIAVPQLRNLYDRVGYNTLLGTSRAGFGFSHNGSVDTLERFVTQPLFHPTSEQDVADLLAFLLSFSGSDLPQGSTLNGFHAPGTESRDTHAGVGVQTTLVDFASATQLQLDLIDDLTVLAQMGEIGLIARRVEAGRTRGYRYFGSALWQSDRSLEFTSTPLLLQAAAPGSEVSFCAVPLGSETRLGVDRDGDGFFNGDEIAALSDPTSAASVPSDCFDGLPEPPTGLVAASAGPGMIELAWDPASIPHSVERSPAGADTFELLIEVGANMDRYTDSGLDCSQAYDYRVTARNCAGQSDAASASTTAGACDALSANTGNISVSEGGRQTLRLRGPSGSAGSPYLILGSLTGTSPGVALDAGVLPLNVDDYLVLTLEGPNLPPLIQSLATLDATGHAIAAIELAPDSPAGMIGLDLSHAFVVFDSNFAITFVSNAVGLTTLP